MSRQALIAAQRQVKTAIVTSPSPSTAATAGRSGIGTADFAAVLAWWDEAGVDCAFADESRSWLVEAEAAQETAPPAFVAPVAPPPPVARIGGPADGLPGDLATFRDWWLAEPSLDDGHVAGRVPPRGDAGAALMVLVDHPEAGDAEAGALLAGAQGRLAGAITAALGLEEEQVYLASALPRHMPLPDWAALTAAGLGDVVRRHVALAAPQRLLVFGEHVSSLLGHDPANNGGPLREFHHEGRTIPALAAPGLAALAARPRAKARLWQALLDWSA